MTTTLFTVWPCKGVRLRDGEDFIISDVFHDNVRLLLLRRYNQPTSAYVMGDAVSFLRDEKATRVRLVGSVSEISGCSEACILAGRAECPAVPPNIERDLSWVLHLGQPTCPYTTLELVDRLAQHCRTLLDRDCRLQSMTSTGWLEAWHDGNQFAACPPDEIHNTALRCWQESETLKRLQEINRK